MHTHVTCTDTPTPSSSCTHMPVDVCRLTGGPGEGDGVRTGHLPCGRKGQALVSELQRLASKPRQEGGRRASAPAGWAGLCGARPRSSPFSDQLHPCPVRLSQSGQAPGTDRRPAGCHAAGTLCPRACQPVIAGPGFGAQGQHSAPQGSPRPSRQVGREVVRKQSSGVLRDNSAERGCPGWAWLPAQQETAAGSWAGRRGPEGKGGWTSPRQGRHSRSRCKRKRGPRGPSCRGAPRTGASA